MKRLLIAALFAGSAFVGSGVATAEECYTTIGEAPHLPGADCPAFADCSFNVVAQETATGGQDTYTGAAYGVVVAQNTAGVTIRCYVRVDGTDVGGTTTGSGAGAASTQGPVTFTATDTQDVDLCTEWTINDGADSGGHCDDTTNTQIPPQVIVDLIEQLTSIPDFLLCPVLQTLGAAIGGGVPGVVEIDAEGDVYLAGDLFWDCPPYEEG